MGRLRPLVLAAALLAVPSGARATPPCHAGWASRTLVGRPTRTVAWRAGLRGPTGFYRSLPRAGGGPVSGGTVAPSQAPWLLVLGAARARDGRCWVRVRLPWRPNDASGWLAAARVRLRPTVWSIVVSLVRRTLTLYRAGVALRRARVVIGAPATPTPTGLFALIGAWRSPPTSFYGTWILTLTAHSPVLRRFDGGDGRTGIHGRGGASLRDPLGSARSHGCVRLTNVAIDELVHALGAQLPGTPVWVYR